MSSVRRIFIILSSVIPTLREGAKTINLTIIVVVQVLFFGIAAVFFFFCESTVCIPDVLSFLCCVSQRQSADVSRDQGESLLRNIWILFLRI